MTAEPAAVDPAGTLLALYDDALPEVYGYLLGRCRDRVTAEDLAAEVFMAAVSSINRGRVATVTTAWLIGIARHKLVDHWRRLGREQRRLEAVADESATAPASADQWDRELDDMVTQQVLGGLAPHHRIALTLRYVDGLPVPEVAQVIDRTVHATEALLVRARTAFRRAYEEVGA